jgi:superfamily II helicase
MIAFDKAWSIAKIEWVQMCPKCYAKKIPGVGMNNNDNWKGTLICNRCFEIFSSEEAIYRTHQQFDEISRSWTPNRRPWDDVE